MTEVHEGGCLCGAIRFRTQGQPMRTTICHCRFCQRGTGSAFLVEPIFPKTRVEFTGAATKVFAQRSEGSGKTVSRHFCADCGVTLCLSFERFPDVLGVYAGTFDDPNWFDRGPDAARHIFTRHAMTGVVLPAGFKTYPDHALQADGTANPAEVFERPFTVDQCG